MQRLAANECSNKTAPGELISDHGGLCVQGTTEYGCEVTFPGRKADVHKTLVSSSKVHSKGHVAVVISNGGTSSLTTAHMQDIFNNAFKEKSSMNLEQYVCILRTAPTSDTPKSSNKCKTRNNQEVCSVHARQQSGGFRCPQREYPMASVGEAHSFLPTQSLVTKLQIRRVSCSSGEMECLPFESKIVDAGFNNETIEVQQHHVVAVGRGPTKLEIEHHVTSGHAQHRPWCDACMKARRVAGRHEKPGSLVERTRTRLLALDHGR